MAEVGLQRPCVMAPISQRVAACVTKHMWMGLEGQLGRLTGSFDHSGEAGGRKGRASLRGEHKRRPWLLLAPEPPQGPQFFAEDRMRAGSALLEPADVQGGGSEIDLLPAQVGQFGRS